MSKRIVFLFAVSFVFALLSVQAVFGQLQGSASVVKARPYASVDAVRPGDKFKIAVALDVAEGYHINAHVPTLDFLKATTVTFEPPAGIRVGPENYPAPRHERFEFSEQELAVHEGTIYVTADAEADQSIKPGALTILAKVQVQACNNTVCLRDSVIPVELTIQVVAAGQPVKEANADVFAAASSTKLVEYKGSGASNSVADLIASRGLLFALFSIFVAGLLLNATPCVYPIIPITIGFFVNQSASQEGKPQLRRTFFMASMYVLGMAITYSVLGVIASLSKGLFGAALQNPIVLIVLAGLMVALALSMFGVYEFRMPEALNRFATTSTQSTSGSIGALVMGLTMGIVAAPCIGPFVLALLVFVGEKGDPLYGFLLFFVLALGLGLPYLVLGTFSGAIKALPRSGMWMVAVRKVFGLVLIGMALYFLKSLLGRFATPAFVAYFALSAVYLIVWEAPRTKQKQFAWVLRGLGVGVAALAVWWAMPKRVEAQIIWQPYSEQALADAQKAGKGVIIDSYADWCIPCKELDEATFTDPSVARESERFITLKLDLTSPAQGSEAERAVTRYKIAGVPTLIFLDPAGQERSRLIGFEKPAEFLARMKQIESAPASQSLAKNSGDGRGAVSDATPGAGGTSAEPAPAVTLDLLAGGKLDLASLRGKVVVLDFWATWCVPCKAEIPTFNELSKQYKDRGLEVVAVSYVDEGPDKVKPFLKQNPMIYTQVIGNQSVADAFKVGDSLPIAVIIDKQGRVRFRHEGITKKEVFEADITQLLAE